MVLNRRIVNTDAELLVFQDALQFNLQDETDIRISLRDVGTVKCIESKKKISIYFSNCWLIVMEILDNKDFNSFAMMITKLISAVEIFPFQLMADSVVDNATNLLSQSLAHENGWKVVSIEDMAFIVPASVNYIDYLLRNRKNHKPPSYIWVCWDKNSHIYGSILMTCERPLFIAENLQGTLFTDYFIQNRTLLDKDAYYFEEISAVVHEKVSQRLQTKGNLSTYITIMDTGVFNQQLTEVYPNCNFMFLNISNEEIEKRFLKICRMCNSAAQSNLVYLATQLK